MSNADREFFRKVRGMEEHIYDSIIIGAGPGGLQAAIYLGRYNLDVLLIDRSGGRTWHARHIENILGLGEIPGSEIIARGVEQAKRFNVRIERDLVVSVRKDRFFTVATKKGAYQARTVIAASGISDVIPPIENAVRFLGAGFYTCIDCDGYAMTGRKSVVMGDRMEAVNLAIAVRRLYTPDVTFLPVRFSLPDSAAEVLADEGIAVITEEPMGVFGEDAVAGIELQSGRRIPCEAILVSFGVRLNDEYLAGLDLRKDAAGFRYAVNSSFESSRSGLYIVGPLNTGNDQVVIAAGEGAAAAIDINKRLLEEKASVDEVCSLAPGK